MSDALTRTHDGWIEVTLNRPERRNALSPEIYAAIIDATQRAGHKGLAAIVISGAGGYFCAGGDLGQLATRRALPEAERAARIEQFHDVIRALRAAPCPVIAATGKGAAGAGMSLMLACDLIVADRDARFALSYIRAGLTPDGGALAHLGLSLPRPLVARMALFGDAVPATRLHDLGLITDLAEPGGAQALAHDLATRLASGPRAAQSRIKALMSGPDLEPALAAERDAMAISLGADEAAEGISAFHERRAPIWPAPRPPEEDTP